MNAENTQQQLELENIATQTALAQAIVRTRPESIYHTLTLQQEVTWAVKKGSRSAMQDFFTNNFFTNSYTKTMAYLGKKPKLDNRVIYDPNLDTSRDMCMSGWRPRKR